MKEFSEALLDPFGLRMKRYTRSYGAFICDTDQGTVLVKSVDWSEGAIWFAHGVKEHLAAQGFLWTDRYWLSQEGLPWAVDGGMRYTVRQWIKGEEADVSNAPEAIAMAGLLGKLHRLGMHWEAAPKCGKAAKRYDDWPRQMQKGYRQLQSYGKGMRKNGHYTEFDLMVLSCLEDNLQQAKEACHYFMGPLYTELARQMEEKKAVVHGSFAEHAVMVEAEALHSRWLVSEFEQAAYAIPAEDCIALLEKVLRKNEWSVNLGMAMLEAYERERPLETAEKQMIYAGLLFPSRLCKLCKEAYHLKRKWMPISYKRKLEELLAGQEKRKEFLRELACMLR